MRSPTSACVSVVIPTHNRASLLARAIRSVLGQTYQNLEVIVVDDGSTDGTREVVRSFQDSRIDYLFCQKNQGSPAARNLGLRAARGPYVAFLDDDDEWDTRKLERQVRALEQGGLDAILCGISKTSHHRVTRYDKPLVEPEALRRWAVFFGAGSSLMAKIEVLRATRFDEALPIAEDWDLLIRLTARYRVGYRRECLVICHSDEARKRMTTAMKAMSIPELEERMRVLFKHREFLGPYWFRFHVARTLPSYIRHRDHVLAHVLYTMRRCGVIPVIGVFWEKICRNRSALRLSGPWLVRPS